MSKQPDRYDVSGNIEAEYVDEAQTVLVNLLGITSRDALELAEEEALARAYEYLLNEARTDTPLRNNLIYHAHKLIFGEIYGWAGRLRTVTISKPGIIWPPPPFLQQSMDEFEKDVLQTSGPQHITSDDDFCRAAARIQGEFLVIHPFREGNARTIKLLTDLLALQTGRPLLAYDSSAAGRDKYILAASQAFRKNYRPMEEAIRAALESAR